METPTSIIPDECTFQAMPEAHLCQFVAAAIAAGVVPAKSHDGMVTFLKNADPFAVQRFQLLLDDQADVGLELDLDLTPYELYLALRPSNGVLGACLDDRAQFGFAHMYQRVVRCAFAIACVEAGAAAAAGAGAGAGAGVLRPRNQLGLPRFPARDVPTAEYEARMAAPDTTATAQHLVALRQLLRLWLFETVEWQHLVRLQRSGAWSTLALALHTMVRRMNAPELHTRCLSSITRLLLPVCGPQMLGTWADTTLLQASLDCVRVDDAGKPLVRKRIDVALTPASLCLSVGLAEWIALGKGSRRVVIDDDDDMAYSISDDDYDDDDDDDEEEDGDDDDDAGSTYSVGFAAMAAGDCGPAAEQAAFRAWLAVRVGVRAAPPVTFVPPVAFMGTSGKGAAASPYSPATLAGAAARLHQHSDETRHVLLQRGREFHDPLGPWRSDPTLDVGATCEETRLRMLHDLRKHSARFEDADQTGRPVTSLTTHFAVACVSVLRAELRDLYRRRLQPHRAVVHPRQGTVHWPPAGRVTPSGFTPTAASLWEAVHTSIGISLSHTSSSALEKHAASPLLQCACHASGAACGAGNPLWFRLFAAARRDRTDAL